MLRRSLLLAAALLTMGAGAAVADDDDWVGFYMAIDVIDGSIDSLSIVENDDETYRIVMSSTGLAMCAGGTQPGLIMASGRVVEGQLVRRNVVARCAGAEDEQPLPDGTYVRDDDTGILRLEGPMGRVNYYHPIGSD
jgi:hypothetical protein